MCPWPSRCGLEAFPIVPGLHPVVCQSALSPVLSSQDGVYICVAHRFGEQQDLLPSQLSSNVSCAVAPCTLVKPQDPSYPAYVDSSIIIGQTGGYREDIEGFDGIEYMRCGPDNGFFPDLSQVGPKM